MTARVCVGLSLVLMVVTLTGCPMSREKVVDYAWTHKEDVAPDATEANRKEFLASAVTVDKNFNKRFNAKFEEKTKEILDRLKSLETAVADLDDRCTKNKDRIEKVKEELEEQIGHNEDDIKSNKTGITENQRNIGSHDTRISSNKGTIDLLNPSVVANSKAVGTLDTEVSKNEDDIENLGGKVSGNTRDINSNESKIGENKTKIKQLETDLGSVITKANNAVEIAEKARAALTALTKGMENLVEILKELSAKDGNSVPEGGAD